MLRVLTPLVLAVAAVAALPAADSQSILHAKRSSPGDLEVGGELTGVPSGATRYVRYEDLLHLEQETWKVSDDTNFPHGAEIGGVPLESLARLVAKSPESDVIVAICDDKYQTHYPRSYMAAHRPILVLRVNGQLRDHWPVSEHGGSMGPYLISHPVFKPGFKVLSHADEPQIPYGVVRIEFRRESLVYGAIRPPGDWPAGSPVAQGYAIAREDCFRCHNAGAQGGTMSGLPWLKVAERARGNSRQFRQTIRDPASVTPGAMMPAHPDYDDATLDALTAYFKTFSRPGHPAARKTNP